MTIRNYRSTDFSEILKVYSLTKLEELRFENQSFEFLPLELDEVRLNAFKESKVFVYEEAEILGYCAFFGSEIRALFVLPKFQGKGIGKKMLNFMLENISGTPSLKLVASNAPAKKLYESFGFNVTSEFIASYNGKSVLAIEMCQKQKNANKALQHAHFVCWAVFKLPLNLALCRKSIGG